VLLQELQLSFQVISIRTVVHLYGAGVAGADVAPAILAALD